MIPQNWIIGTTTVTKEWNAQEHCWNFFSKINLKYSITTLKHNSINFYSKIKIELFKSNISWNLDAVSYLMDCTMLLQLAIGSSRGFILIGKVPASSWAELAIFLLSAWSQGWIHNFRKLGKLQDLELCLDHIGGWFVLAILLTVRAADWSKI